MDETDDESNPLSPHFPVGIRIAGAIWVLFGIFVMINSVMLLWLTGFTFSGGISKVLPIVAVAFVVIGWRTLRGSAKTTVGNGLGSIVMGVLVMLPSVIVFGFAFSEWNADAVWAAKLVAAGLAIIFLGVLLILAGIMAIQGRRDYLAWRLYQLATTPGDQS